MVLLQKCSIRQQIRDEKLELIENDKNFRLDMKNENAINEIEIKEKIDKLMSKEKDNQVNIKKILELEFKLEASLKEIRSLDDKVRGKDSKIKILDETIQQNEKKIKELINQIKENNDVYFTTLERKQRDIAYYKKLVEEQQLQFTKENDMILNKLFELSLQFNALKCDWDKKIQQEN